MGKGIIIEEGESRVCPPLSRGVSWGASAAKAVRPVRMIARTRRDAQMPLPGNCRRTSKSIELLIGSFYSVNILFSFFFVYFRLFRSRRFVAEFCDICLTKFIYERVYKFN